MPVFLHCCLCERYAVDGFLSRYAWGHVELNPHGALQICPVCKEEHTDWEQRALETTGSAAPGSQPDPYGGAWSSR